MFCVHARVCSIIIIIPVLILDIDNLLYFSVCAQDTSEEAMHPVCYSDFILVIPYRCQLARPHSAVSMCPYSNKPCLCSGHIHARTSTFGESVCMCGWCV